MIVTWRGNDITNKPTLIYHDEVQIVQYSPPPELVNPSGPGGLLCTSSTLSPVAWWAGDGKSLFDSNRDERKIYQIIPNGNLTAQVVRDGRNSTSIKRTTFHNGLFSCRQNGDISTAVPVGFYGRGEMILIMHA